MRGASGLSRTLWPALIGGAIALGCTERPAPEPKYAGTLHVKGLFTVTGPTADVSVSYTKAILDAVAAANADGGVRGHEVRLLWTDYGYDVATAVHAYAGWKADGGLTSVSTIFGWGTGDTLQLSGQVKEDQIPYISASYAGSLASPLPINKSVEVGPGQNKAVMTEGAPYNFFAGTDYSTAIRLAMKFVHDEGAQKIAFAYCDKSYCTDPIPAGKAYAARLGLAVGNDVGGPGLESTPEALARIDTLFRDYFADPANDGVDWVWIGNSTGTARPAIQAIKKYRPRAKIVTNIWGFDENLFTGCAGDAGVNPCIDDVYGVMSFAAYGDTRFPGMEALTAVHDAARAAAGESSSLYQDIRYVQGYASFALWRAAVESLVDQKKSVTGPNIKAALEAFDSIELGGLAEPLRFRAADHRPSNSARIYSFNQLGKLQFEKALTIDLEPDWLGW